MTGAQQVVGATFVEGNRATHMGADLGESQDPVVVPALTLL